MGRVYVATDSVLKRQVALKMLLPERGGGEGAARFAREASLAAMVTHPNVVAVYDYGTADAQPYIAMEYVEGETLTGHLGDKAVPLSQRLQWLLDVGRALAAAHEKGLVHRDVKPSNVMVTRAGVVKVLDFGLAKQTTPTSAARGFQTLEGRVLGTPRYMAPEQLQGQPVSAQTDQYGLGVLAYELVTGVHPNGPTGRVDPPKLLTEIDAALPFRLAVLVARMLAKKPEDRFPSMHELNAELERVISECAPGARDRETSPLVLPAAPHPGQTLPVGGVAVGAVSTLPMGKMDVPAALAPAVLPETARAGGGRVPAGRTLPSEGTPSPLVDAAPEPARAGKAAAELGTLRSAYDDGGRPLGLAIDEVVRRAEAAARADLPPAPTPERRAPPAVLIVPASVPPPSRGWSKTMWLTVIAVGVVGVIAGALLTAWAIGGGAPEPPKPAQPPPNVVF